LRRRFLSAEFAWLQTTTKLQLLHHIDQKLMKQNLENWCFTFFVQKNANENWQQLQPECQHVRDNALTEVAVSSGRSLSFFLFCCHGGLWAVQMWFGSSGIWKPNVLSAVNFFSVQRQMALARSFIKPERQLHFANSPN
jgi:hypothetical protein